MKKLMLVVLMLLALMPATATNAQDFGSPEDNACNPGGAMYRENPGDGCTSEWHWVCGWYMARFYTRSYNVGGYDTTLVPDWCASLLPPRPVSAAPNDPVTAAGTLCISDPTQTQHDLLFSGTLNQLNNGTAYISKDGTCSGGVNYQRTIVQAPTQMAAETIVNGLSGVATATCGTLTSSGYTGVAATWYQCIP